MTVTTIATNIIYADPDGIVDQYSFPFAMMSPDDITAYLDGALMSPGLYTVTYTYPDTSGFVVFTTAPTGTTLELRRATPETQELVYTDFDAFPAKSHEAGLDRLTMINQEQTDRLDEVLAAAGGQVTYENLDANLDVGDNTGQVPDGGVVEGRTTANAAAAATADGKAVAAQGTADTADGKADQNATDLSDHEAEVGTDSVHGADALASNNSVAKRNATGKLTGVGPAVDPNDLINKTQHDLHTHPGLVLDAAHATLNGDNSGTGTLIKDATYHPFTDYVAQHAIAVNITVDLSLSKFTIPVGFGGTYVILFCCSSSHAESGVIFNMTVGISLNGATPDASFPNSLSGNRVESTNTDFKLATLSGSFIADLNDLDEVQFVYSASTSSSWTANRENFSIYRIA